MRKILEKFCLALFVPVVLFVFFFVYEPFDYWTAKGWSIYTAKPISAMRELRVRRDGDYLLIGDSRMANLNTDMVSEAAGVRYVNLAFGGGTLGENAEQLRYVFEDLGIVPEKVVVGLNFYTASPNHSADRIFETEQKVEKLREFISVPDYWYYALREFEVKISEELAELTGNESIRRVLEDPTDPNQNKAPTVTEYKNDYRYDILAYSDTITAQIGDYGDIRVTLETLNEMIDLCEAHGTKIEFVLWPCNRCMFDRVIDALDLQDEIDAYKDLLKSRCVVYDMEWESALAGDDSSFLDGFHLVTSAKQKLISAVFGGESVSWCTVSVPEDYLAGKAE